MPRKDHKVCGSCGNEKRRKSFIPVKDKGTKKLTEVCKNCAKEKSGKYQTSDD